MKNYTTVLTALALLNIISNKLVLVVHYTNQHVLHLVAIVSSTHAYYSAILNCTHAGSAIFKGLETVAQEKSTNQIVDVLEGKSLVGRCFGR